MKEKKITAYKGFDKNLCCRGFQYEIGKEYEHEGEIECCSRGFHACTNPFDVLDYYNAYGENRYCEVEQSGTIEVNNNDSKLASSKIKIKKEIGLVGLLKEGVKWIKESLNSISIINEINKEVDSINNSNLIISSSNCSQISSRDNYVKIGSKGEYSQISTSGYATKIGVIGYWTKIGLSGDHAQIGSNGNYSRIGISGDYAYINLDSICSRISSSGDYTKISSSSISAYISSSGDYTKIGSISTYAKIGSSGDFTLIGASGNFAQIGISGDSTIIDINGSYAKISSSGDNTQIKSNSVSTQISTSGNCDEIDSIGEDTVICCAGKESIVKARLGSWITLAEWKYSKDKNRYIPICVKTEYVDGKHIKADTWYTLVNGEFKEQLN